MHNGVGDGVATVCTGKGARMIQLIRGDCLDIATTRIQHATDEQKQPRQLDF